MELSIGKIVIVKENNQKATIVAVGDKIILVEFEDGSEFGYIPSELLEFND